MLDYDYCEFCLTPIYVPEGYVHGHHTAYCSESCYAGTRLFEAYWSNQEVKLRQDSQVNTPLF